MAAAASQCCLSLVRGLQGESNVTECLYVEDDEYAPFFARPVRLGPGGVAERLPLPDLDAFEEASLQTLLPVLHAEIATGESLALPLPA